MEQATDVASDAGLTEQVAPTLAALRLAAIEEVRGSAALPEIVAMLAGWRGVSQRMSVDALGPDVREHHRGRERVLGLLLSVLS